MEHTEDREIAPLKTIMKSYISNTINIFLFIVSYTLFASISVNAQYLDTSFGEDGKVTFSLGHFSDQALAVAIQSDGKIVVAGSSSNGSNLDFALARYNSDGSLDTSFNYDGTVTTLGGSDDDVINSIALQEDGRIVAGGYSANGTDRDFAILRYNSDGTLDSDFGSNGMTIVSVSNENDEITSLAIDDDGRIIVTGYVTGTNGRIVSVSRYNNDGSVDSDFGDQGMVLTSIGDDAVAESITLQSDGKIIIAGTYSEGDQTELMVLRYLSSGTLDTSFGTEGQAIPVSSQTPHEGYSVQVQDDGAIVVAGSAGDSGERDAALFRFTNEGKPDESFGENGVMITSASEEDDVALAVVIEGSTIYMSGYSMTNDKLDFLYVSYKEDSTEQEETGEQVSSTDEEGQPSLSKEEQNQSETEATTTTTSFSSDDDISYALALKSDGTVVAVGSTEESGVSSFAIAQYTASNSSTMEKASDSSDNGSFITTKDAWEITRTSAYSGGEISSDKNKTIEQRGVVFSIHPDPTLDTSSDESDNSESDDEDSEAPNISDRQSEVDGTKVTISVSTDEDATCRYDYSSGVDYDSMSYTFSNTGGTNHSKTISGLDENTSYTIYVRCEDESGNQNSSDYSISFSTDTLSSLIRIKNNTETISSLFVATAYADDSTSDDSASDDSTSNSSVRHATFGSLENDFIEEGYTDNGSGTGTFTSVLEDLKPGTFYYVRAYAKTSDGNIYYGNQVGFTTADSCFIATASYGSIDHPYVKILRNFRDKYLMTSSPGRSFVRFYYDVSPGISDIIANRSFLRSTVRVVLLPVVGVSWFLLHYGISGFFLLLSLVFLSMSFLPISKKTLLK